MELFPETGSRLPESVEEIKPIHWEPLGIG